MDFRRFVEMADKWAASDQAWKVASNLIRSAANGTFKDLADFHLMIYTDEELEELGETDNRDWVGQYVAGSIDSDKGATVLINIDKHVGVRNVVRDMTDTILHEMGHALWELLDNKSQQTWKQNQRSHRWGPEEAFADDFMYLCNGETYQMNNEQLFMQLTVMGDEQQTNQPNQHQAPAPTVSQSKEQSLRVRGQSPVHGRGTGTTGNGVSVPRRPQSGA